MKVKYPKQVPVLEGEDFCQGMKCRGMRCLIGWSAAVFLDRDSDETGDYHLLPQRVKESLLRSIRIEEGNTPKLRQFDKDFILPDAGCVFIFNDGGFGRRKTAAHRAALARVWNRAMEMLGYTEAA